MVNMLTSSKLTFWDYVVFGATIAVSIGIGIFFAIWDRIKKKGTLEDYFLAGRKGKAIPVGLSFIVTFLSSILVVGFPAEGYLYGSVYGFYGLGTAIAYTFSAFFIVPVFHPLQLTTVYEYMALRFGNNVLRYVTLVMGLAYGVFYMGTVTFGTCVVLQVVIGIPFWASIIIYSTVTAIYTTIGGIKAVIWSDAFQYFIMVAGFVTVVIKATNDAGGWSAMVDLSGGRLDYAKFSLDPSARLTFWNMTFGSITMMLCASFMQPGMQRIYSVPNTREARKMLLFASPFFLILCWLAAFEGGVLFAYYNSKGCDIYAGGVIENVNEIVPFAVMDMFNKHPGIPGLFVASLSCAALSTLSSFVSSLSAIVYEDIIKVHKPNIGDKTAAKLSRVLTLAFGAVSLGATFLISVLPGTVVSLFSSLTACLDGPTCAIFILAAGWRRATTKGILVGTFCGITLAFLINLGKLFGDLPPNPTLPAGPTHNCDLYFTSNQTTLEYSNFETTSSPVVNATTTDVVESELTVVEQIYNISYMLISLVGFTVTMIVGIIVSLLTKPPEKVDERCIFSFRKHIVEELFGKDATAPSDLTDEEMKFLN